MVIVDGYQYDFPQQRILEMMISDHCNHTLYQFFKAKALKLEANLRHREGELTAAEALIAAKDEEILDLKNRLKGKERIGAEEEKLRLEIALARSELETARNDASSSKAIDIRELTWLRNEKTRQASRIRELMEKIKDEADKWNARADEHNELMAQYRQRREQMVDIQNRYNYDRLQFDGAFLWTRENLREAREGIYRLETRMASLEEELRQYRSSHDPEVRDYIQQLVRERDDARAEAHALSNALAASRSDVARLVDSEKDLEINMYKRTKGIEEMSNKFNHLRHLDSMKQIELDECQFALTNLRLDYKKISDEYDFLDEAWVAVVNEYEIASARVEDLEGQLNLANENLEKAQSSLAYQECQAQYFEGLAGSRDTAAKEAAKEVARLTSLLLQSELKATVITHKSHCSWPRRLTRP
ncbi:intracellular protein transport protein uso1-like [Papaver somniferum]|uniref:intracellular protein transport protein uso1-like n=1 Tax=Papaver somniferum TaxID=3469 RepID=UPI000E6FD303|nr:intracellular protein transport protein uso1-like [Papaver somniferum]